MDDATALGTGTLSGAAQATFATSALGVATRTITTAYGGDANYASSTGTGGTPTGTGDAGEERLHVAPDATKGRLVRNVAPFDAVDVGEHEVLAGTVYRVRGDGVLGQSGAARRDGPRTVGRMRLQRIRLSRRDGRIRRASRATMPIRKS